MMICYRFYKGQAQTGTVFATRWIESNGGLNYLIELIFKDSRSIV
jgi:hypothetical protein